MKLVSVNIHSFGCLERFKVDFKSGLHDECKFNGYGKSTLAAYIKAMFYGMDASRNKSLAKDERARFRPWSNTGKFGGTLTFERGGKNYRIERMFGDTPKSDTAPVVYECATNKPTKIFGDEIGLSLFQLTADDFERCLFVPQKDIQFSTTDNFRTKINAIAENSDESHSYAAAAKRIKEFATELKKEIKLLNDLCINAERDVRSGMEKEREISDLKTQIKELEKSLDAADAKVKEIDLQLEKQSKQKLLSAKFEGIKYIRRDIADNEAEIKKLTAKLDGGAFDEAAFGELTDVVNRHKLKAEEYSKLNEKPSQAPQTPSKAVSPFVYLGAGALFAVLAVVLGITQVVEIWLGIVLAVLGFGGGAAMFLRSKNSSKQQSDATSDIKQKAGLMRAEIEESNRRLTEIFGSLGQYGMDFGVMLACVRADMERLREKLARRHELESRRAKEESVFSQNELQMLAQTVPADADTELRLRMQRASADELRQKLTREIAQKETERQRLVDSFVSVNELRDKEQQLKEDGAFKKRRYEIAAVALEALGQAKANMSAYFLPEMQRCLEDTFARLTDDRFSGVNIDTDFNITVNECGASRNLDFFSEGIKQVCMFCLRMAVIDTLFKNEPPFILLDDPFVQIDTDRFLTVCEILRERAKRTQIIYLTCHKHAEAALKGGNGTGD